MFKKVTLEKRIDFVSALMEKGPLFAPVKGEKDFEFQRITDPSVVTLDFYNTSMSPKFVFFPQSEDLIRYRLVKNGAESAPVPIDTPPSVILGVRPCDAKSFEIMDRHFLGAGVIDPYWKERRDKTTVIGYPFDPRTPPDPADFYNALGIRAADPAGSDVLMIRRDGDLLLKSLTEKGSGLLTDLALSDGSADDERAFEEILQEGNDLRSRFLEIRDSEIAGKLSRIFEDKDFWEKTAEACIGCGICTFVCPTCYCFDISDETLFNEGMRKRFWDVYGFYARGERAQSAAENLSEVPAEGVPQVCLSCGKVRVHLLCGLRTLHPRLPGEHRYLLGHRKGIETVNEIPVRPI